MGFGFGEGFGVGEVSTKEGEGEEDGGGDDEYGDHCCFTYSTSTIDYLKRG